MLKRNTNGLRYRSWSVEGWNAKEKLAETACAVAQSAHVTPTGRSLLLDTDVLVSERGPQTPVRQRVTITIEDLEP